MTNVTRIPARVGTFLAIFLLGCCMLSAQTNTAVIRGVVTDPAGANIVAASITATNGATGVVYSATSNETGLYLIPDVPAGPYTIKAEHQGFRAYVREAVTINTGATVAMDIALQLGNVNEAVTVTGEAPLVQSETSGGAQLVDSKSVADIPLGDRKTMNVIQLVGTAVFAGYDSGQKPNFSLAGGRAQSQVFWIDGSSDQNMRLGVGQMETDPPVEMVQEIQVLTNNYSAEFGGSNGGVIIETTKSGANQYHGSAIEYLRNDKMDAPGFFAPVKNGAKLRPELRYNLFGGTFSGPIRKNKTFFFGDFEGGRRRTGYTSTMTVPTNLQRTGDFSQTTTAAGAMVPIYDPATTVQSGSSFVRTQFPGNAIPSSRFDSVAMKMIAYYPIANQPASNPSGANNYSANGVNMLTHDFYFIKVDHTLNANNRLSGRYMYNRDNANLISPFPDPAPDPTTFNVAHQESGVANWVHTLSSTTVNDFRATVARRVAHALSAGVGGDYASKMGLQGDPGNAFPNIQTAGFVALGNTNQERQQYPIDRQEFVDNLSSVHGRHTIKAGVDMMRSRNHEFNYQIGSGSFTFATTPTGQPGIASSGSGLASMLLGFPTAYSQLSTQELDRSSWYLSAFVQDDWTVSRSLTLNLGVRWETDTPMVDSRNRMNGFDPNAINPVSGTPGVVQFMGVNGFRATPYDTNWDKFAPRIGFAWKITSDERTVVRGGFGTFFGHPFDAGVPNSAALGFSQQVSLTSPDNGITPPFYLRAGIPGGTSAQAALTPSFGAVAVGQSANTAVTYFDPNRGGPYSEQFNLGIQRQIGGSMVFEISGVGNLARKLASSNISIDQIAPQILNSTHSTQAYRPFPQFSNVSILLPTLGVSSYFGGMLRVQKRFSHGLTFNANYTWSHFLQNTNDIGTAVGSDTAGPFSNYYNRRADWGPSANDVRHRVSASLVYDLPFGKGRAYLTESPLGKVLGGWTIGSVTTIQSEPPMSVNTTTNNCNCFSAGPQRPDVTSDPNLPSGQRSIARWFNTSAFAQPAIYTFGNSGRNIVRAPGLFDMDFSLMRNFSLNERFKLEVRAESVNALNHTNFSAPGGVFGTAAFGVISAAGPARTNQVGARLAF
jgi:hypothetical protein